MQAVHRALAQRTAVVFAVVLSLALVCTVALFGWRLWLLLFASIMLALLLRGISDKVAQRSGLGARTSLVLVMILTVVGMGGTVYLIAPQIAAQGEEFIELLPAAGQRVDVWAQGLPGGAWLGERIDRALNNADQIESARQVAQFTYQGVVGLIVILVAGVYLAIDPDIYVRGLVRLLPVSLRAEADGVLHDLRETLQLFMLGRLASMVFVAPATGIAAWLLGVPAPAVLALIAGLFTFVPYAGPIVAAIPIALLSATSGMDVFAWMMIAYTVAQAVEGFVITPLVGEWTIKMPPVLTIAAEVLLGSMFGPIGVIVSVPLAAAAMVLVRRIYVERILEGKPRPDDATPSDGA